MNSEPASDIPPISRSYWAVALQEWETKRAHYQKAIDQTADLAECSELQLGLETCQGVIATCQELLLVLAPPLESDSLSADSPEMTVLERPASPSPLLYLESEGPALVTDSVAPMSSPGSQISGELPRPLPQRLPSDPPLPPSSTAEWGQHRPVPQRIWQVVVPCFLITVAVFAIFRPKNVCKIAPDGTHRPHGLVLWVEQALQADPIAAQSLGTVYVAQTGCTIRLKGTVSNQAMVDALVGIAQNVEVPSQVMAERFIRQFQLGETQLVKPVKRVVVELEIAPEHSRRR